MIKNDLVVWINEQIAQGYDLPTLRNYLLQLGYPQVDVDDSISSTSKKKNSSKPKILLLSLLILFAAAGGIVFFMSNNPVVGVPIQENSDVITPTTNLTPKDVKEKLFTATNEIRNYQLEQTSNTTTIITYGDLESIPATQYSVLLEEETIVDRENKKVSSKVYSLSPALGAVDLSNSSSQLYVEDGFSYSQIYETWIKSNVSKAQNYFVLDSHMTKIQTAEVELISNNSSHIRMIPDKYTIGKEVLEGILIARFDKSILDQFSIRYDETVKNATFEYWLNDEYQIIKSEIHLDIIFNMSVIETDDPEYAAAMEFDTSSTRIISTSSTEFKGFNVQNTIVLPPETKDALSADMFN